MICVSRTIRSAPPPYPASPFCLTAWRVAVSLLMMGLITAGGGLLAVASGPSPFGSIVGIVRHPSGGVVPGCRITVHQETTSARCATRSDPQGSYGVANLEPGTYTVDMEAPGFQRATYTGITLSARQTIRVDGCVTPLAPSESDPGRAASERESRLAVSHPAETRTPFAALEQQPRERGRAASWFDRDADLDWVGEEMGEPTFHALSNLLSRDKEGS
jgi:Carboxypeptidase regulatory-like domain